MARRASLEEMRGGGLTAAGPGPCGQPVRRACAAGRLQALAPAGSLSAAHVRLAASGLGVSERTVWRWLAGGQPGPPGAGQVPADWH